MQEGKLGKGLKKFLTEEVVEKAKKKETLVVVEPKLGKSHCLCRLVYASYICYQAHSISKKLSIQVTCPSQKDDQDDQNDQSDQSDLWRGIRSQIAALIDGLDPKDLTTMSLALSHSLSR